MDEIALLLEHLRSGSDNDNSPIDPDFQQAFLREQVCTIGIAGLPPIQRVFIALMKGEQ